MRIDLHGNCSVQIFVRAGEAQLEVSMAPPLRGEFAERKTSLGVRAIKFVTICLAAFAVVGMGILAVFHLQQSAPAVAMLPDPPVAEAQAELEPGTSATLPPAVQNDLAGPAVITPPPQGSPHGASPSASGAGAFGLQP